MLLAAAPLLAAAIGLAAPPEARAQQGAAEDAASADSMRLEEIGREFLFERMDSYEIHAAANPRQTCQLQEDLLLGWHNPVSGSAAGCVHVWTDQGRPAVICKCHVNHRKGHWVCTLVPLQSEPLIAKREGSIFWRPPAAQCELQWTPAEGDPAESERGRLIQMRTLARTFHASGIWGESSPSEWAFRLMPNPLYRYRSEAEGIVDGVIFGFTQGTNPEAILLIEAVRGDDGPPQWRFAAARLTKYAVRVSRDQTVVLDVPRRVSNDRDSWSYHGYHPNTGHLFGAAREEIVR